MYWGHTDYFGVYVLVITKNMCICSINERVLILDMCIFSLTQVLNRAHLNVLNVLSVCLPVDGRADRSCDSCFCRWSSCVPSLQEIQTVKSVPCTLYILFCFRVHLY